MIARSAIPRRVRIGDDVYDNVPPPTIQDAFETIDLLRHAEDDSEISLLRVVLERWLSPPLTAEILELGPADQTRVLRRLLTDGSPTQEPSETEKKTQNREPVDLDLAFAQYLETTHSDPWTAYTTHPFPFFLAILDLAPAITAHRELTLVNATAPPNMTKEDRTKYLDDLHRRIGQNRKKRRVQDYTEPLSEDDLARERKSLEDALLQSFRS